MTTPGSAGRAVAAAVAPDASAETSPQFVQRAVAAYIIVAVGRVAEVVPGLIGLPVAKIVMAILCMVVLLRPGQLNKSVSFRDALPRRALWFFVIAVISVLFSIYKSNSAKYVLTNVPPVAAAAFFVWKSILSQRQLRFAIKALQLGGLVLVSVAAANYAGGRLQLSSADFASYDTNDLAYVLVTVLPLSVGLTYTSTTFRARVLNAGCAIWFATTILLTQSRGGFLAVLLVPIQVVLLNSRRRSTKQSRVPPASRGRIIVFAVATVLGLWGLWHTLPEDAQRRLSTVLTLDSDYNADLSNTTSRLSIWTRALTALAERPIGYGIDSFPTVDALTGGKYKAPHNTFLEVAVELGVVGFLVFLALLKSAFVRLRTRPVRTSNSDGTLVDSELIALATSLRFALLTNVVASLFLSQAYSDVLWILLGIIAATHSLLGRTTRSITPLQKVGRSPRRFSAA